jgi:hypothetical protein
MNSVHGQPVGVVVICTRQALGIWFSYMEIGVGVRNIQKCQWKKRICTFPIKRVVMN